ncbi:MAG: hypothetical protein AMJ79_09430 [Phycisphaerae bacterium SM23_30]|nr:MAG: hypothetical protein AMJ79_09430 [Phycisphaerae bacterium SM23_30]
MSVYDGRAKLVRAAKNLFVSWERTKEGWRDENSRQFEKKYITLLQSEIHNTQQAMDHIAVLLHRLRQECT